MLSLASMRLTGRCDCRAGWFGASLGPNPNGFSASLSSSSEVGISFVVVPANARSVCPAMPFQKLALKH